METYTNLRKRQQKEFEAQPMFFAFNDEQMLEGLASFGLERKDTDKIVKMGMGAFMRREDACKCADMLIRHAEEFHAEMKEDLTGEGFIFEAFDQELSNHEYVYTRDTTDALRTLCLTEEDIDKNPALQHGLKLAINNNWEEK